MFNKARTMPWCRTKVLFEVKMSHFSAVIQENRPYFGTVAHL